MRLTIIGSAFAILAVGAVVAEARRDTDGFAVYEDWTTTDQIRGDRWRGLANPAQDTQKEQQGHRAHLRLRREASNASNAGGAGAELILAAARPLDVTRFDVETRVKNLELVGCPANPVASSVMPVQVTLNKFNDGTPGLPGDATGDHFGRIRLFRSSGLNDPPGALQVHLAIFRCDNPACSAAHSLPDAFVALPTFVYVGDKVRVRLIWDEMNNRFVGGVNNGPDMSLAYPAGLNKAPARSPFANISVFSSAVSCLGQAGVVDADVEVGLVRTNPSAVIP